MSITKELDRLIKAAIKREENDDHLDRHEREYIVDMFKKQNPDYELSPDLDEAFIEIIF